MGSIETLEILSPGPLTSIQDLGRYGFGRHGVAPSGALDSFSLRIGNLLVNNTEDEACLEITLMGLRARALTDLLIAITGADLESCLNDKPIRAWRSHILRKGETLSFKGLKNGCRAYLAVGGGINITQIMGSKSTNLGSGFGGLEGRPLQKDDVLLSDSPHMHLKAEGRELDRKWRPSYTNEWVLRVVFGPQDDHFTQKTRNEFLSSPFKVKPQSDRTGIRLKGPMIHTKAGMEESIISEGVISGTIQIPGDGQPIIILNETVSGGYRKIATVITADLPILGQMKPEDSIFFQEVSIDDAYLALSELEGIIKRFKQGFPE